MSWTITALEITFVLFVVSKEIVEEARPALDKWRSLWQEAAVQAPKWLHASCPASQKRSERKVTNL